MCSPTEGGGPGFPQRWRPGIAPPPGEVWARLLPAEGAGKLCGEQRWKGAQKPPVGLFAQTRAARSTLSHQEPDGTPSPRKAHVMTARASQQHPGGGGRRGRERSTPGRRQ